MIEPTTPEEEEAFNELERMAKQRMEAVKAAIKWEPQVVKTFDKNGVLVSHTIQYTPDGAKEDMKAKTQQEFYDELRNGVIEEVAMAIERMKGFGGDTISSFAIYIRGMKK